MKILMLVNWKIEYCDKKPSDKQAPDYDVKGEPYWFYRYFNDIPQVDVVDIRSFSWLEKFEKNKIRFYIWQTLKVLPRLNQYDLIVSHGMQSGVVLSLWRRIFKTKAKHIVFDIGSFNSAAESGVALKLMQHASKSLDGVIYHTSWQKEYYEKFFPWIVDKSHFIKYGVDFEYFGTLGTKEKSNLDRYVVCVGRSRSDWDTAIEAYKRLNTDVKLRFIGGYEEKYAHISGIEQIGYMPITELISQIQGAECCLLPLEYVKYSFGQMRFLQQQALGKCVIASRIPSLVDYATDYETAIFYNPGDCEDCANKLQEILDNKKLRDTIGLKASASMKSDYNEEVMANEIEKVLRSYL